MDYLTTNDKIVGWYRNIEFVFSKFNRGNLDSCAGIGKINDRACKALPAIQNNFGELEYLPPPELPSIWLFIYRQAGLYRKSPSIQIHIHPENIIFLY